MTASYRQLLKTGALGEKSRKAHARLSSCDLCAHACRANRQQGAKGICQVGNTVQISSYGPHFGEEDVLRPHLISPKSLPPWKLRPTKD